VKHIKSILPFSLFLTGILSSAAIAIGGLSARGPNVFTYAVASRWGGVVLQGTSELLDATGTAIAPHQLKLQLETTPDAHSQVCLNFADTCYQLDINPKTAFSLATWIKTGQTGAYTAIASEDPTSSIKSVRLQDMYGDDQEGYIASELAENSLPEILHFLDFELVLNDINDSELRRKYNLKNGFGTDFESQLYNPTDGTYINTDTDTDFKASLADGQVTSSGTIARFSWEKYSEFEEIYITDVQEACTPESIQTYDTQNCSGLNTYGLIYSPFGNELEAGSYVAFYLVAGSTADTAMTAQPEDNAGNIFLSLPAANAERYKYLRSAEKHSKDWDFNPIKVISNTDERLQVRWEDVPSGGDRDFNDFVVNTVGISDTTESSQGVFQVEEYLGAGGYIDFEIEEKNAAAISEFGFFKVDAPDGRIGNLMPEHPDYLKAALTQNRHRTVVSYADIQAEIETYYPHQKKAISLVQTAAILRRLADENPQALATFIEQESI